MIRDSRDAIKAYDGVAELYWDSIDNLIAANSTAEGVNAGQILLEDEQNFIDPSRFCIFFTEEHTIVGS